MSRFPNKELFRACSRRQDLITTSQGGESQMSSSEPHHIRCMEPQKMLTAVISTQVTAFLKRKRAVLANSNPGPLHTEKHITQVILKARRYQQSVRFIEGTHLMQATIVSQRMQSNFDMCDLIRNLRCHLFAARTSVMLIDFHVIISLPSFVKIMGPLFCTRFYFRHLSAAR